MELCGVLQSLSRASAQTPPWHRAQHQIATDKGSAPMQAKDPIEGYVRCETLMPILGVQILPITDMPTRRVLALLTEDGPLTLGVTAESAQDIARLLEKAASEMRLAS